MTSALGSRFGVAVAAGAAFAALGAAVAIAPKMGPVAVCASAAGLILAIRRHLLWWDVFWIAVGGALLLDYGFANVGLKYGVPIPLAELALVVLLGAALLTGTQIAERSAPFVFAALFVVVAGMRLAIDFPKWGTSALRDFTLPIELAYLAVGYWALRTYGVERWIGAFRWIFVACLLYFAFYPLHYRVAEVGPTVGLQTPVPLLGNYWGAGTAAASAFFFFALVRPFGRMSFVLAAGCLGVVAIVQMRGLYLAIPVAMIFLLLAMHGSMGRRLRRRLSFAVACGVLSVALLLPLAPAGRVDRLTAEFLVTHVGTLVGEEGPGAGSLRHRREWIAPIFERLEAEPARWIVGVGLGPDLASGFQGASGLLVRKPHNDYVEILARLGLVGLVPFCAMLAFALHRIVRAARASSGREAGVLWWIVGTAFVFLFIAATQPLLFYPYGTMPLFTLLGAGLALARHTHDGTGGDSGAAGGDSGAADREGRDAARHERRTHALAPRSDHIGNTWTRGHVGRNAAGPWGRSSS